MLDPNDEIIDSDTDEDEEQGSLDEFGEPHNSGDEDEPFGRLRH